MEKCLREIDECLLAALARGEVHDALAALAQGADANAIGQAGQSALRVACEDARAELLIPALLRAGARMEPDADGLDPLEACCANSNWISACSLAGSDQALVLQRHVDFEDAHGTRLAAAAAALGHIRLLQKLADIDPMVAWACDAKGLDPFWHACESGNARSAEFLCPLAPADKAYPGGCTRLHLAARAGSPSMVRSLLDRGARIGVVDQEGQTCMHHAAFSGSAGSADALVGAGEPYASRDANGRLPLDVAVVMRNHDVAALLRALHERDALSQALHPAMADGQPGGDERSGQGGEGDGTSTGRRSKRL